MAEVFLGMQEGIGGFEKLVVIKRIFQHYCEDERFLQMFMDEARLAASIRHPNVIEILDIDRDATGFFIVMEYLSGETLGYVIPTLQSQNKLPPPHLVCRIGASIAAGLHQAHTAHDATGAPQPVVHRDVTPSNVIVCYNGVVKLLDFGVAKAILSGEGETRVRGIKGKMSYLAPEQIANAPVDGRADIFQLGIVIHELLTGRGLFHAANAHQRVLAVMEREIPPPSRFHPDVPEALDEVVLAALERDPEKRVQSADELRSRLEQAIHAIGAPASDRDVGAWMRQTFPDAHERRLALERGTASQMRQSRQLTTATPGSWTAGSQPGQTGESSQPSAPGAGSQPSQLSQISYLPPPPQPSQAALPGARDSSTVTVASESLQARSAPRRRRLALMAAALLLLLVAGGTGIAISIAGRGGDGESRALRPTSQPAPEAPAVVVAPAREQPAAPEPAPRATYRVELDVEPEDAVIELDGAVVGRGSFAQELTADGANHVLVISADGYQPRVVTFRDQPPERRIALQALTGAAKQDAKDDDAKDDDDDDDDERRSSRRSRSRRSRGADEAETSGSEAAAAAEPSPAPQPAVEPDNAQKRRPDSRRPSTDNLDPWAD